METSLNDSTKTEKKSDAILNAESVENTFALLKKATDDPASAPQDLISACSSQGSLASLALPEFGICSMSLNTMKTHSDNNGNILWSQMDALRKSVINKHRQYVRSQNKPARGSKTYLEGRLDDISKELQQKINEIIKFVDRYDDLLELSRDHACLDTTFQAKLKRHLQRYSFMDKCNGRSRLRIIDGGRVD